jgi:hypothetical protein
VSDQDDIAFGSAERSNRSLIPLLGIDFGMLLVPLALDRLGLGFAPSLLSYGLLVALHWAYLFNRTQSL